MTPPPTIDPSTGPLLDLAAVAALFPATRRGRVHVRTVRRWAEEGVRRGDGVRVYLPVAKAGSRTFTTRACVRWFVGQLGGTAARPSPEPPTGPPAGAAPYAR